ncbi:MAG: WecB/TagA/CpsF family glycosyltransferase, partial [Pirellulales bacterium]|nr:WecB/TagA/CpsF family glycosyltransferase [Pirellulales bacterium]
MNPQVQLFGFDIDAVRMPEAVERVYQWVHSADGTCRYVVTPNVDHAVMYQENEQLRQAYESAAMILADGLPVVLASRLLRKPVPERVAGSDLVPALFEAAKEQGGIRIFLLGAAPGVAERAAENIHRRWPDVNVVDTYSPPLGFEHDAEENTAIVDRVAAAKADVLVVGLGAPKQELWVHAQRERLAVPAALCVGATIDFLAGEKARAPQWMQRTGLEWL